MFPLGYNIARINGDAGKRVIAHWYFDPHRPYVLIMRFVQLGEVIDWELEREGLRSTIEDERPSGSFEVQIRNYGDLIRVELQNNQIQQKVELDFLTGELMLVLHKSYNLVSAGEESKIIDESIEKAIEQLWTN